MKEETIVTAPIFEQITAGILAGGAGRRMGGLDKGWIRYQGRPMIEHVLERVKPQVASTIINANRNLAGYGQLGVPVIPDHIDGLPGPLIGIIALLRYINTPYLLLVPCDAPCLPTSLARRLAGAFAYTDCQVAIADDGQQAQPLFALIHKSCLLDLQRFFAHGGRAVHQWLERVNCNWVDFSDQAPAFRNFNTPDYLRPTG